LSPDTAAPRGRSLFGNAGKCYLGCGDGRALRLLAAVSPRGAVDLAALAAEVSVKPLPLG
jgi:hypothetical protein